MGSSNAPDNPQLALVLICNTRFENIAAESSSLRYEGYELRHVLNMNTYRQTHLGMS